MRGLPVHINSHLTCSAFPYMLLVSGMNKKRSVYTLSDDPPPLLHGATQGYAESTPPTDYHYSFILSSSSFLVFCSLLETWRSPGTSRPSSKPRKLLYCFPFLLIIVKLSIRCRAYSRLITPSFSPAWV